MGYGVVSAACLKCSFGTAATSLMVPATRKVIANTPSATVMDYIPNSNIIPFGMCQSVLNPAVAAATAMAAGVLTPQPCTPVILSPWANGSTNILIGGVPALINTSIVSCAYSGAITIVQAGQMKTILGK